MFIISCKVWSFWLTGIHSGSSASSASGPRISSILAWSMTRRVSVQRTTKNAFRVTLKSLSSIFGISWNFSSDTMRLRLIKSRFNIYLDVNPHTDGGLSLVWKIEFWIVVRDADWVPLGADAGQWEAVIQRFDQSEDCGYLAWGLSFGSPERVEASQRRDRGDQSRNLMQITN